MVRTDNKDGLAMDKWLSTFVTLTVTLQDEFAEI